MNTLDRLHGDLLPPLVDDFCATAAALAAAGGATTAARMALLARLNTLQECGDRLAGVLGKPRPLWDDLLVTAGVIL